MDLKGVLKKDTEWVALVVGVVLGGLLATLVTIGVMAGPHNQEPPFTFSCNGSTGVYIPTKDGSPVLEQYDPACGGGDGSPDGGAGLPS